MRTSRGTIAGPARDHLVATIGEICGRGLGPDELRAEVLPRLRRAVPVDALWWASVDPATLLFTRVYREEIPPDTGPYFVENEFLDEDANKWVALARDRGGVRTLLGATGGKLERSARFRDVFRPLGLHDELRAVFRDGGACWGFACLHREGPAGFTEAEAAFVRLIAPIVGAGIRLGLLAGDARSEREEAPGLVLLDGAGAIAGTTPAGERWLDELAEPTAPGTVPLEVLAVAAQVRAAGGASSPRLRARTRAGRWAVLHASPLADAGAGGIAVIVEEATGAELAPVVMHAYGLTPRERTVTALVCRGLSTSEIAARLRLSEHTIQDHLKSIFAKTGVRSRRELVPTILRSHYLLRAHRGEPLGPDGFFADAAG